LPIFCRATLAAFALSVSAAPATGAQPPTAEELIVTVQKKQQAVLDVPAAVTALSGETLDAVGVTEFDALARFVPGFEVQNQSPNNPAFIIRGITSDSGSSVAENRVSIFQDGVSISRARGAYVELFDIARIEVAKGPQSTLFGRSALIGAVDIVQNKADPSRFDAAIRLGTGDYDYRLGELIANLPLGDTAAVRLAARVKKRDGYVDNALGGEAFDSTGTSAARLSLNWTPSDRLKADVIVNYQEDSPSGTSFKSNSFLPTSPTEFMATPPLARVLGDLKPWTAAALSSSPGFQGSRPLGIERQVRGVTGLVEARLTDKLTLSSISAWRDIDSSEVFDPDGLSLPLVVFAENAWSEQWSQELRLNYESGGRFHGFLGTSYFDENGSQAGPSQIDERVFAALQSGALTAARPNLPTLSAITVALAAPNSRLRPVAALLKPAHRETFANFGRTRSWDLYADGTWALTPRIEVSAGLRYTHDDKTRGYQASLENGGSVLAAVARGLPIGAPVGLLFQPTLGKMVRDFEDEGLTWRLVGRYKPAEAVSLYAAYARGRQPKVLSPVGPTTPFGAVTFNALPAETVDSFEIGAKGKFLDARLGLDAALYYYAYENFQTTVLNTTGQLVPSNAGEATAPGLEVQADYRPTAWLQLFGSYAYSHARFQNGVIKGNRPRSAPEHSVALGAHVTAQTALGALTFTPTYAWQSKIYFDVFNDKNDAARDEFQNAYGLLGLRLAFVPRGSTWKIELFADNVLDKKFVKDAGNTGDAFGLPTFIAGAPRTVGAYVSVRY